MGPTKEMCNLCVHACMTPWTFKVNTPGAAGVFTWNVVLHLFSVGFPHVSVGGIVGNHWRLSSAPSLFQRAIKPSNSRACDFQRYQVSLATHSPNGKTDSKPGCMFQQPNALVQRFPSVRWLAGIRFPHSFSGPDLMKSQKMHLNTSISMNEKKIIQQAKKIIMQNDSQPSTMIWLLLVLVAHYHYCSHPLSATQVYIVYKL